MPLRFTVLSLLIWLLNINCTHSQVSPPLTIDQAYVVLEVDSAFRTALPSAIQSNQLDSIPFSVKVVAHFSDTSAIDSVHFRVGRSLGGQDIIQASFAYNGGTLPTTLQAFVYSNDGFNTCVATSALGVYTLYLEIWAVDKMGQTTPIYRRQIN